MRFLLDQNFDRRVVPVLHELGHDVTVVAVDYPPGIPDPEVIAIAHREGRIILTNDRDFGELAIRDRIPHAGILYFRVRTATFEARRDRLLAVLTEYADQLHHFLVVEGSRVRIQHTPRQP